MATNTSPTSADDGTQQQPQSTMSNENHSLAIDMEAVSNVQQAASAAASKAEACGDDAGNLQYCDPWDRDPTTMALRLLRAEEQRNKSPTPADATPATKGVLSTKEMARQWHINEAALDLRLKQQDPDQGLDQMAQSLVIIIPGLQQQPRTGPIYPMPLSFSSSSVSVTPGCKGGIRRQASLQNASCPKPPPHQESSCSTSVSSSIQQQPAPTPRDSSSSGSGNPSVPIPGTRDHGLAFEQASAAIDQSHPLTLPPISQNPLGAPVGAVTVKRSIHADVKVLPSESVRRIRHSPPQQIAASDGSDCALQPVIQSIIVRVQPLKLFL
ncbi:hypothetical protein HPB49_025177 [Dermacentor silvarum]|uniref:Uncharacterized protein n=1 Tax=Dermacentor silvarum TaxID=543639 RepID=A0ACB8CIN2_DERSI|nr:hypothetical protein HPB49_025177 [Dermacentor silvarum]